MVTCKAFKRDMRKLRNRFFGVVPLQIAIFIFFFLIDTQELEKKSCKPLLLPISLAKNGLSNFFFYDDKHIARFRDLKTVQECLYL